MDSSTKRTGGRKMKFDEQQLRDRGFIKQPDGSWRKSPTRVPAVHPAPAPEPEPCAEHAQAPETPREAIYPGRVLVRVESRCCGIQHDPDNIFVKWVVDCCRYSGIISGDSPDKIELRIKETRVPTRAEEGVEIIITPL